MLADFVGAHLWLPNGELSLVLEILSDGGSDV
jgi:hypothetical protein